VRLTLSEKPPGIRHIYLYQALSEFTNSFLVIHLGLFENSHMQYELERDKAKEPSIAEMTNKAVKMLQKNDNGFFLLVEGECCTKIRIAPNADMTKYDCKQNQEILEIEDRS
jgi:hypothetical protein